MPEIVIDRVNKLSCKDKNQFIFTDRIGIPIGDIITWVDRGGDDRNENQIPQDPPKKLQETEEAEEEQFILDHNTDLTINHKTSI